MKKTIIFSTLMTFMLLSTGCFDDKKSQENINKDVQKPTLKKETTPKDEYHLTSIDGEKYIIKKEGNSFLLKDKKEKVVILDIFATWCPPCRASATHLSSLQEKYKDDLTIIGVSIESPITNEKLQSFKETYNANYVLVNSNENERLIKDAVKELDVGSRFPIPLVIIYKDGKTINHYIGATEEEFIESDIKRVLEK